MIDRNIITRIIESTNIVDIVGDYIKLKKKGTNYQTLCPFHDEKTPSFMVSESKQIFKCFGCGKAGNVISFLTEIEKITFVEAIEKLANRSGIAIEKKKASREKNSEYKIISDIHSLAKEYYIENLKKYGDSALEYLKKRKLSEKTIEKFEIGLSLNSFGGLTNHIKKYNYNEKLLIESGLFAFSKKSNSLYDFFRNRIMFPIHSASGNVIAFGARLFDSDKDTQKYVNSPNTLIYYKSKELYGLNQTKYEISRKDSVIICEGYLDLLKLYENGFTNSVASLGTALTNDQVKALKRYTNNFILIYDGDKAGCKAAIEAGNKITSFEVNVRIVKLPDNSDPDNYIDENGKERLNSVISQAKSYVNYLYDDKLLNLNEYDKLSVLIELVKKISDPIFKDIFINSVIETFNVSKDSFHEKLEEKSEYKSKKTIGLKHIDSALSERKIIIYMLKNNFFEKKFAKEVNSDYFLDDGYRNIYNKMKQIENEVCEDKVLTLMSLFNDNSQILNLIGELSVEELPKSVDIEEELNSLKIKKYEIDLERLKKMLNKSNYENENEVLLKISELKNKINKLSKKVVRKIFI